GVSAHGEGHHAPRHAARTPTLRRLDRSHCRRRTAVREAGTAARHRTQRRDHAVGLSRPTAYLHDAISTDPPNPRVNANGKIYGSPEDSSDFVPILDPKTNVASEVLHPVRDPNTPSTKTNPMAPSAFWGPDPIWDGKTLNHNPMMDEK